jgi:hypothetical protein
VTSRRSFAYLPTIAAVGAVIALGGCAAHHPTDPRAGSTPAASGTGEPQPTGSDGSDASPGPAGTSAGSPPSGDAASAGNGTSAGGAAAAAGGVAVTVRLTGPASCRRATDGALLFDLVIANSSSNDYHDIAPLVVADRYPGGVGPLHVLAATLEQQDPAKGTWHEVTMPAGADATTLQHDWPTVAVSSHNTLVLHYRLTPWPQLGAGTAHLRFYALRESDHRALGQTTQPLCFA